MPLGKNVRPSTAVGRLETYNTASIFHNAGPASGKSPTSRISCVQARARTSIPESRAVEGTSRCLSQAGQTERPEWSETETETEPLKHHPRRHSVGLGQSVATNENVQRFGNTIKSLRKGKIEQQVSLTHLKSIQAAFEESRNDGRTPLDVEGFKMIMKKCLGYHAIQDDQIEELFRKIDYSADGQIEWDEFCTYMQLKYKRIEESYVRSKRVSFSLPATFRELSHAEQILRIYFTPDQSFIMMREDGTISFWSAQLKLKRSKRLFEKPFHRKPKWVTDFTTMYQYNKFILSTGDREIQIYELSTFEPYCQIAGLETCPLQLDYCSTGADDCMILYGDDQGCVNILLLTSVAETLRTWKKCPKVDNMPSISIENSALSPNMTYIRWKVHEDWVTQLKYYDSITSVITASSHEATALVIGCTTGTTNLEKQMKEMRECWKEGKTTKCHGPCVPQKRLECDQSVFCVHKGVKTFDLCKKKNLLVTGGMDRMVRMWNPYVPGKATGSLRGHCAPICFISITTDDNKLFSVSTDNTIKIWDTEDQCCLYTANQQTSGIKGDISTSLYIPAIKALCIAADSIALLHLKIQPPPQQHHVNSHKEPALCCVYCREFRQVISCSEGSHIGHKENPTTPPLPEKIEEIQRHASEYSLELLQVYGGEHIDWLHHSLVIKVWDLDTGNLAFEFSGAHDGAAICCMTFDDSGRRLITGGRDGCVKIWNHNNGHCLKILKKEGRSDEICDCTYVEMHKNNYILAVGWDRRINIYCDSSDHLHHVLPPQPHWPDDLKWGHKDDILCIAQCPPTLLATSSYDGETIVWNMISGHICCHLQNPSNRVCEVGRVIDKSVSKVIFLKSRALKIELGASLVTTGPQGSLVFWSLLNGGQLYAAFPASRVKSQLTSLGASTNDSLLYTADDVGYICVYGIKDYAVHGPEAEAAKLVHYWRAHVTSVTCMELIEEQNLMVTSSFEGTVRLWNMDGELIGTFGQPQAWDIYNPAKWVHPMVPYEVLIDPLSLPIHPVLEEETAVTQQLDLHQSEDKKQIVDHQPKSPQVTISDEDIKEEIRNMSSQNGLGKRLRQERFKRLNRPLNHGGPSAYHTLKYFEINTPNPCEKPDLSAMGEDPYDAICFTDSTVDLQACVQEIA